MSYSSKKNMLQAKFEILDQEPDSDYKLSDGARVAVVGCGPAGSFFSYFLLDMAQRLGIDIQVDIYDNKDFSRQGPTGCNMCGGIISETLVQTLSAEGINLPPGVIQRGIDSYVMHTDVGSVCINTPLEEKRIGAVHRGAGPKGTDGTKWRSFDGYLQMLAKKKGAHLFQSNITGCAWENSYPRIAFSNHPTQLYDLLAVTIGVNTVALKLFNELDIDYKPPITTKTLICEYYLGEENIEKLFGNSMHVFLLNIPRLQFAAIVPKVDHITICMLGKDIDDTIFKSFINSPEVKECLPFDFDPSSRACKCMPRMNINGAQKPFANRIVFIGDSGVTRLNKDGIGGAYRTAKAAASTAIFQGVSAKDFKRYYWPTCKNIHSDNMIGKLIFMVTHLIQKRVLAQKTIKQMALREQNGRFREKRMSIVLWDMFTGSASFKDIFLRTLHPFFLVNLLKCIIISIFSSTPHKE